MRHRNEDAAIGGAVRAGGSRGLAPVPLAPAVIPLAHAPDDPGPDAELHHIEPAPEPTAEPPADSWSKIRQLFKQ